MKSYIILFFSILVTFGVTYMLYARVQEMFKNRLQERLISMAATASVAIDLAGVNAIDGPESVDSQPYKNTVLKLQEIRNRNQDIKYVYIFRKTEDPNSFIFVADADSLNPFEKVDLNEDGVVDESDALNVPGDSYDVSEFDELRDFGFLRPTVDSELTVDQWGTFLSSSAPIFDEQGKADEIIGMDVDVSDYIRITNLALIPFVAFVIFLLFLLVTLTLMLVKMWGSRVNVLKDLDRQKDELLSIVSHQLATPVSSIKWYLEMLIDGDLGKVSKEQKEHMQSMSQIALNLSDLVSMILDVSRIQLGRMRVEKQELDLSDFFKEILEIIEPKAIEKKVELIKKLPKKLPKAMLDRRYTHMTIENLLSNAIKYTPEGGKVSFDVEIQGNTLSCTVKDTGVGIPKSEQDKIFGRMFRASNVRNEIDGNGFGLYVAKGAVEAQGGKIWFESTEGKGTTFFVELPLKDKSPAS